MRKESIHHTIHHSIFIEQFVLGYKHEIITIWQRDLQRVLDNRKWG